MWAPERICMVVISHCTWIASLIFNNKRSQPPARIERRNLHLQEYNFTTIYTKGFENPSDFLSRYVMTAEQYVNFVATHATPNAMSLTEIKQATKDDPTLQNLIELINSEILMPKS